MSLLRELVEGVAFLHDHNIAHCDLNPSNIGLRFVLQTCILDYDWAIQVSGPNDLVTGFRGTHSWVAPEVLNSYVPYRPILADRWAVGKIMEAIFTSWTEPPRIPDRLVHICEQLLSVDPLSRPTLQEVGDAILAALKPPHSGVS